MSAATAPNTAWNIGDAGPRSLPPKGLEHVQAITGTESSATCPHCGGRLPTPEPVVHRGELERQLGDPGRAADLRLRAFSLVNAGPMRLSAAFIAWRGFVWAPCHTRKAATCWVTGLEIPVAAMAYRQLSDVRERERRVSADAWAHV